MRKIVGLLDEEQREALLELVDFATAIFSAGLAVAVLKGTSISSRSSSKTRTANGGLSGAR
jgi:hypothetical protein